MSDQEWPTEEVARLRQLWADGVRTRVIGESLGRTKSSIIGKAHRIGLASRPSPIPCNSDSRPVRSSTRNQRHDLVPGTSLPPLPRLMADPPNMPKPPVAPKPATKPAPPIPIVPHAATQKAIRPHAPATGRNPCCWPLGTPKTPDFRFCGKPALIGRPYCEVHHVKAHTHTRIIES